MIMNRSLMLSISILLSHQVLADDSLLFFGGGGEPFSKDSTIFDSTLIGLNNFLLKNHYSHDICFNGGHSYSEGLRNNFLRSANSKENFTERSYEKLIDKYKDNIKSGKIRPGEKLLILIDTHGAEKEDDSSELTHHISINSRDLKGNDSVSLDEQPILFQPAPSFVVTYPTTLNLSLILLS